MRKEYKFVRKKLQIKEGFRTSMLSNIRWVSKHVNENQELYGDTVKKPKINTQ